MKNVLERIIVRDDNQFEIKYTYPLQPEKETTKYFVEMFLFLPQGLNINNKTYGKKKFYRDSTNYIRFKTPAFSLPEIIAGKANPLYKTTIALKELIEAPETKEHRENYDYHLKMFSSILKSALRDEEKRLENIIEPEELNTAIKRMVVTLSQILTLFRELRNINGFFTLESRWKTLFALSDEYNSIIAEFHLFKLLDFLGNVPEAERHSDVCADVRELINLEVSHRSSAGYPSIVRDRSDNETFLYRARTLKKIMGSILFLHTQNYSDGRIAKQFMLSLAAGLAMSLAMIFLLVGQKVFGNIALWLVISTVIGYIIRDRTKESSRALFSNWIEKYFFDYKTIIMDNLNRKIGECRSSISFLEPSAVPQDIVKIRNRDILAELAGSGLDEEIIYSRKQINLNNAECSKIWTDFRVEGINDIVRVNLDEIMSKMDKPERELYFLDGEKCAKTDSISVYHLNMILRYGMDKESETRKIRLILNSNGIRRIVETII
ncbi:MAG: hypothetical protein PHE87_06610 [Victivallaceae bacterium]|nr:hypothetical protein [Victivallaceae bacterium]